MKIAHVVLNYDPSVGGTQLLYKGISEHCVRLYNDEVEVLTVDSYYGSHTKMYKNIQPATETINGVIVRRFSFIRFHKLGIKFLQKTQIKIFGKVSDWLQLYATGPWSPSLKKAIENINADVISASPSGFLYMQYPLYRHKLKNPKPFVYQGAIHFADNDTHQVITKTTLKAIKASDYYLANTEYEKNRLINLGVPEDMIVVTGVAADIESFEKGDRNIFRDQLGLLNDEVLVGYIGRIEKTKSIDILIDAFISAYQKNAKIKLVIGGYETNYSKQIKLYVESLDEGVKKNIFFLSNLGMEEKTNLFCALDIFVLPSVNESFGIVFLEAWACKKPVIGTSIGAVKSVISDGEDGLIMLPYDKKSLTEKILILAEDKDLRIRLGENGYTKTLNNYTWEAVTKKFRDTYLLAINKFNNVQRRSNLG